MATKIAKSIQSVLTLNDGVVMPMFGLGVYKMSGTVLNSCILAAFKHGYRLLDTAKFYGNEKEVGDTIRNSGLKREDIFVVTKLWHDEHGYEESKKAFHASLKRLELDYVDLYLIHSPTGGQLVDTYKALMELKAQGLIRSVGVSNFGIQHLEGLREAGLPVPSVNQIQLHAFWNLPDIVKYCRQNGITVMGYSPLMKGKKFDDPNLVACAEKYKRSPGQFLIRWSVQNGFITIPKTANLERIVGNADVFDWSISEEDMRTTSKWPRYACTVDNTTYAWTG